VFEEDAEAFAFIVLLEHDASSTTERPKGPGQLQAGEVSNIHVIAGARHVLAPFRWWQDRVGEK